MKLTTGLEVPNLQVMAVSKLTEDLEDVTSSVYKSTFQIDLQTDEVAQYVWLEAIGNFAFQLGSSINDVTNILIVFDLPFLFTYRLCYLKQRNFIIPVILKFSPLNSKTFEFTKCLLIINIFLV